MTRIVVCCGAGGVGKTTVSAALATSFALAGRRTVVLTIDPARRLADALSLGELDNEPRSVPLEVPADGSLHALMLDRKATFDAAVRRFCNDNEVADRLLRNRYYLGVSTRLSGSHEYMATEKLEELVESDRWDVVVVDTPPAQHAIDFLTAPERIGRLLEHGVLSVLTQPHWGLMGAASRSALRVLERIAGDTVVLEIAEFFQLISAFSKEVRQRNRQVHDLLRSEQTCFYLVTTPTTLGVEDVATFAKVLAEQDMHLAGLLVNRVIEEPVFAKPLGPWRFPDPPRSVTAADWAAVVDALVAIPERLGARARLHRAAIDELAMAAGGVPVWKLPDVPNGVNSLEALAEMARRLPTEAGD